LKLTTAIEILADSAYSGITTFDQDFRDAEKLLIEAGKLIKRTRQGDPALDGELLPGETPEDAPE